MFNAGQMLYLKEVLGVSPNYFVGSVTPQVVVLTGQLSDEENQLLIKILNSVRLTEYQHLPVIDISRPPKINARHMLAFQGLGELKRSGFNEGAWWSLPLLSDLLGSESHVVEKKKQVWQLLQQFAKEVAS